MDPGHLWPGATTICEPKLSCEPASLEGKSLTHFKMYGGGIDAEELRAVSLKKGSRSLLAGDEFRAGCQELNVVGAKIEKSLHIPMQLRIDPFSVKTEQLRGAAWTLEIIRVHQARPWSVARRSVP